LEIVEKCKLIHSSRISEVEQLLYYLQKRSDTGEEVDRNWLKKQVDNENGLDIDLGGKVATMNQIDSYIEGLYEEVKEKIVSTRAILSLAKNPENMQELVSNGITS
jgi:hypothetical protein